MKARQGLACKHRIDNSSTEAIPPGSSAFGLDFPVARPGRRDQGVQQIPHDNRDFVDRLIESRLVDL